MKNKIIFLFLILYVNLFSYEVGGYYENWSQYRLNRGSFGNTYACKPVNLTDYANGLTVFYYAFAFFRFGYDESSLPPYVDNKTYYKDHGVSDWSIYPAEWNDQGASGLWTQATDLKTTYPSMNVVLSIGGWSFCTLGSQWYSATTNNFFNLMAANAGYKTQFINSCVSTCAENSFDGIDIDWEFPGSTDHSGSAADYQNFYDLIKDLKTAFTAGELHFILTAAFPAIVPSNIVAGTYTPFGGSEQTVDPNQPATYFKWLAYVAEYLDHVNIMCYDYYGAAWATTTSDNAPLAPFKGLYSVEETVTNYKTAFADVGGDITKLIVGIPAYGHTWQKVGFPSSWDANVPYGPGCPSSTSDEPGEITQEAGFFNYIELLNLIPTPSQVANAPNSQFNSKNTSSNNTLFARSYSSLRNEWTPVDQKNPVTTYYERANYNPDTKTWYAYNSSTGKWVSFDAPKGAPFMNPGDISSVEEKCNYIIAQGLGGAMIWAVDNDIYTETSPSIKTTIVDTLNP